MPSSQISGRMSNTVISIKMYDVKSVSLPADIGKQLSFANNRNRVREVVLDLSRMGPATIC